MILLDAGPVNVTGFLGTAGRLLCSRMAPARCDRGHSFPRSIDLARRHGSDLFLLGHNHLFKSPWLHNPNSAGDSDPPGAVGRICIRAHGVWPLCLRGRVGTVHLYWYGALSYVVGYAFILNQVLRSSRAFENEPFERLVVPSQPIPEYTHHPPRLDVGFTRGRGLRQLS